ncbi:MAG TPA: ABC transporter substrate-binding protein [Chloroflexota bacterium]
MSTVLDRRAFLKQAGVLAVGMPLLAACGSSAPAPSQTSVAAKPASAGASVMAKATNKVSYAFASVNPYHWVAVVGAEKPDLPHKYGIEFDLVTTTNSPNAINALVGGSVTTAVVTPDSAWAAQDKAPDVKQLFATADGTPYVLIAQPEVKKAAELKGKTFGASAVKGGADTTAIMVMMLENGVKSDEYTIVQAGDVAQRTSALKAKAIQGLAQLEPQASLLRDAGFPEIDNANTYPALKNVQSLVLIAKKSWYEGQGEMAASFVRAWSDITQWLYDPKNKDELLAITKKTMSVGDKAAENSYMLHIQQKVPSPDLHLDQKRLQQFADNLKRTGAENIPSDVMKYVDGSLLDKVLKG